MDPSDIGERGEGHGQTPNLKGKQLQVDDEISGLEIAWSHGWKSCFNLILYIYDLQ